MEAKLDKLDRQILSLLMNDGKMPYTDIAKQLYISSGTVHVRMKKLEEIGILKGSRLEIFHHTVGFDLTAFIGIYLDKSSLYSDVVAALRKIPEVLSAYYTTGTYSIFAKLVCRDTEHLRTVLSEKLQQIDGIQRTETFISLEESIDRPLNILLPGEELD